MRHPKKGRDDPVSSALCADCQREAQCPGGEQIARLLLAPPTIPAEYADTHEICPACIDLRRRGDGHANHCALGQAGLRVLSGGWATPLSESLRNDLRAQRPRWTKIVATILGSLVAPAVRENGAVLVPIPVSTGTHGQDGLLEATLVLGERIGFPVLQALVRNRQRSTRRSVAQIRRLVVEEEYRLNASVAQRLEGARVVLVDDTVTTGLTLAGTAALLRDCGVASIVPVTIDRTVSSRLGQRLREGPDRVCPHVQTHIRER